MEEFNYEEDLKIDPDFLDAEFLNHPQIFMKYAKAAAQANKQVKEIEERLKVLKSQLIKEANENPEEALGKGVKATVAIVEAFYRNDHEYKLYKQEWIEATYIADLLNNAVFAFQARKTALENLVRLHAQEYFSGPREPHDLPEAAEHLEKGEKKFGSAKNQKQNVKKGEVKWVLSNWQEGLRFPKRQFQQCLTL